MKVVNLHSDILSDITNRRKNGETNVFKRHYYRSFLAGKVETVVFVIWIEPRYKDINKRLNEIVNALKLELKESKDIINHVKTYNDFKIKKPGQINVLVAFEGLEHLGENIELLRTYKKELGIFYSSLTWNERNLLASGWEDSNKGLTDLGKRTIEIMEEEGIVLDLSHLNDRSFYQALNITNKAPIASHSNSRTIEDNYRNLKDDQIIAIAEKGGLIGVNAYHAFVSKNYNKKDIDGLIDHIDHIKKLVGIDHIALGLDFCDFLDPIDRGELDIIIGSTTVKGLSSEGDILNLISGLENRFYTKDEIEKITYRNFHNFIEKYI